jgi:hypothetical protein
MRGSEAVFHLAANADVRFGTEHPRRDLDQNAIATWNVLEAMRRNGIRRIAFSSTGSVYGEARVIPTPEDCPFSVQTSLYGASKVAAEALISAYCEGFGMQGVIFRVVSILGEHYSHGHVFDFYKQLLEHPDSLWVLGNGNALRHGATYLILNDRVMMHGNRLWDQRFRTAAPGSECVREKPCRERRPHSRSILWRPRHLPRAAGVSRNARRTGKRPRSAGIGDPQCCFR